VRHSPYAALLARIDENTDVADLWHGDVPSWVRTLHEALRKDGGSEKEPAPGVRYEHALDEVATEVDRLRGNTQTSYDVAKKVGQGGDTPFKKAVELVNNLVPIAPDDADKLAKQALRNVMLMPILNGFSTVVESAREEIDKDYRSTVVVPYPRPLTIESQAAQNAALLKFKTETLGPFWQCSGPRPLLEDRTMSLSDEFIAGICGTVRGSHAGNKGPAGAGGAPPSGPQTVRLIGAPSEVIGAKDVFVISQEVTLACASQPLQRFEYSDGVGEKAFVWSPDCESVRLVVRVRGADGHEIEIPREWNGQFAFADFLEEGQPIGNGYQWKLSDPAGSGVRVGVRYRRLGGEGVLQWKRAMTQALPSSAVN